MKTNKKEHWQSLCSVTNKILCGTSCHWVSFMFFWLVTCPNYGQELPKKPVTEKDYHLWGTVYIDKISDKGKWVSYIMRYDDGQDTLFVKRNDTKKIYSFAKSSSGTFSGERQFTSVNNKGTLQWLDLEKDKIINIENVEKYSFSGSGNYLITLEGKSKQKTLCIRNKEGQLLESVLGMHDYKQNNQNTAIIGAYNVEGKRGIVWIGLDSVLEKKKIVEDEVATFSQLVWHNQGKAFTALRTENKPEETTVFYYSLKEKRGYDFKPWQIKDFPSEFFVEKGNASGLTISADARKVLFTIRKKPAFSKSFEEIQQWNGNDAVTYSERQFIGDAEFNTRIAAWWPQTDKFSQITDDSKPFGLLNGNQDFALTFSQMDLEPQYKLDRNVNYYVTDLETGQRNLLLENQSTELFESSLSPKGKYFAYFKENNWWVYNFFTRTHTNVTAGLGVQLINEEDKSSKIVYRVAGWENNDESLLIYDQYDIWKINLDGTNPKRITKGREKGISYAIVPPVSSEFYTSNFRGHVDESVNMSHDILLSGTKGTDTGYFILEPNGKIKTITFGSFRATGIVKADKSDVYLFQKQQFNSPPELVVSNNIKSAAVKVFQSNPHHYKYAWGKQELINYKNSKNIPLNGILYYPADYNPSKKYPMVVHIYEKQTYMFNYYFNPSLHNMAGFNVANLTAQGYFVLLPDIEYELGNPGSSATDCVTAATKEVIRKGVVDSNKIGLIGQSFGGYETNFIIGQTNLFACAISGASVADLVGWYLSIGWVSGRPEIWRNESQQWRMSKSLFEDKKGYERNSPLTYVENIETPVLIWTGEQDRQIHYYQSIAFYLALRRLQKKEIMLIYPKEGHALLNKENQTDLAHRIEDWFGYYLKDERPKKWITEGI